MYKLKLKPNNGSNNRNHVTYHYRVNKPTTVVSELKNSNSRVQKAVSNKKPVNIKKNRGRITSRNKDFNQYKEKLLSLKNIGKNKVLVIFAPGPSILEVEISLLKNNENIHAMTINKPDDRAWQTNYWMFCDQSQYKRNSNYWDSYQGMVINSGSIRVNHKNQVKIKNISGKGFSRDLLKGFNIGRSTTYAAMQVAAWMNYDKVFIFGCDMTRVEIEKDGKKVSLLHSYGVNPDVSENIRLKRFKNEASYYDNAANIIGELRNRFYFCSSYNKWPFVDKYNKLDHKEAIDYILNYVKENCDG